jgi:hypothetical protein
MCIPVVFNPSPWSGGHFHFSLPGSHSLALASPGTTGGAQPRAARHSQSPALASPGTSGGAQTREARHFYVSSPGNSRYLRGAALPVSSPCSSPCRYRAVPPDTASSPRCSPASLMMFPGHSPPPPKSVGCFGHGDCPVLLAFSSSLSYLGILSVGWVSVWVSMLLLAFSRFHPLLRLLFSLFSLFSLWVSWVSVFLHSLQTLIVLFQPQGFPGPRTHLTRYPDTQLTITSISIFLPL